MAIPNIPSNLYEGNSGIFSSKPYTDFAIKAMAQKQAKNEALDKYFAEMSSKINPAGLHPDEEKALNNEKIRFLQDYQQNRDAIHKGDIDAMSKQYQHINTMNDIVANGKQKMADFKALNAIRTNPEHSSLLEPDALGSMDNALAPVYKPDGTRNDYDPVSNPKGYKPFDFNQHLFHDKSLDLPQMAAYYKGSSKIIPQDKTISSTKADPTDPFKEIVTTTTAHSPEAVGKMWDYHASNWENNGHLKQTFKENAELNNLFTKDADGKPIVNPVYQNHYDKLNSVYQVANQSAIKAGTKPQNLEPNLKDLSVAEMTANSVNPTTVETRQDNKQAERADQHNFAMAQQRRSEAFQRSQTLLSHSLTKAAQEGNDKQYNSVIDKIIGDAETHAINQGEKQFNADSEAANVLPSNSKNYEIPLTPVLHKALDLGDGSSKRPIDHLMLSVKPDGTKQYIPIYKKIIVTKTKKTDGSGGYDYNYNYTNEFDKELAVPLGSDDVKQALGYKILSKKDFKKDQLESGNVKPAASNKPTTSKPKKDPLGIL